MTTRTALNRLQLWLLLALALAGSLYSGALWLNNLVWAGRFYRELARGDWVAAGRATGIWPGLDWANVDLSTVTTLVPFLGLVLISGGLLQLINRKLRPMAEWPFFHHYGRLNVALGLLGTVWGIIMIGFYPPEQVDLTNLMHCLHTAMFSTLVAVGWVMVVLPLMVTPLLEHFHRELTGVAPDSLDGVIDEFAAAAVQTARMLHATRGQLSRLGRELKPLQQTVSELASELTAEVQAVATARLTQQELQHQQLELQRELGSLVRELGSRQQQLTVENRELRQRGDDLAGKLAAAESELAELRAVREQLRRLLDRG